MWTNMCKRLPSPPPNGKVSLFWRSRSTCSQPLYRKGGLSYPLAGGDSQGMDFCSQSTVGLCLLCATSKHSIARVAHNDEASFSKRSWKRREIVWGRGDNNFHHRGKVTWWRRGGFKSLKVQSRPQALGLGWHHATWLILPQPTFVHKLWVMYLNCTQSRWVHVCNLGTS